LVQPTHISRAVVFATAWVASGLGSSALASEPALFERPVAVHALNSSCRDKGPCFTCDGLGVYFHSDRRACNDFPDVWVARRPSLASPFGAPALVLLNGGDPCVSCDERTMVLVRQVSGPRGLNLDLFRSTRESTTDPWGEPTPVAELNTDYDELGPKIANDGLSIVFVSDRPGTLGNLDLWMAERDTKSEPFKPPVNLSELNSPSTETNAAITEDGLAIYFASNRPGGQGEADLYRATRSVPYGPFDAPKNLDDLNSPRTDKAPTVTADGLTLLFRSDRDGGEGLSDIYQARDARSGVVGLGRGARTDVLVVNGTVGGTDRRVFARPGAPITVSLAALPFGPPAANYALVGYFARLPGAAFELPGDAGAVAFPAPFAQGGSADGNTVTLCNGLGGRFGAVFGAGTFPAPPGPGAILQLPLGLPAGSDLTLQAIVRDDGARSSRHVSATNAVTLRVE
jgi:WD40 repeat protein